MFNYMIYLLAFAVGSILGLLYSYKKHGEPYVAVTESNSVATVISVIGWILALNAGDIIFSGIGFLLAGFVMGGRPGYWRKETVIGILAGLFIYFVMHLGI